MLGTYLPLLFEVSSQISLPSLDKAQHCGLPLDPEKFQIHFPLTCSSIPSKQSKWLFIIKAFSNTRQRRQTQRDTDFLVPRAHDPSDLVWPDPIFWACADYSFRILSQSDLPDLTGGRESGTSGVGPAQSSRSRPQVDHKDRGLWGREWDRMKGVHSRNLQFLWPRTKLLLNWRKPKNSSLLRWKNTKEIIINQKGTRMEKINKDHKQQAWKI